MPRVSSRLYRRPNSPFWWAVFTDAQGVVRRGSTRCRDRGAAAAWLATRELERVRGEAGIPSAQPVALSRATSVYLAQREPEWSSGWFTAVQGFVQHQVLPHFGAARVVSAISRADVEAFRATQIGRPRMARKEGGAPGTPISDATVNRLMAAMAAFGEWCLVQGRGYHIANPWAKHAALAEDQLAVPDVEEEQLALVLAALEQPTGPLPSHGRRLYRIPWREVVELALETGLRKSELSRLRWEDVRPAERVAFVVSSQRRGRTKARKLRAQALSRRAVEILAALPRRKDGFVFGKVGDPRSAFETAAKRAGLARVWLHLFRHVSTSRLASRGAGRHDLREWGGWSSTKMVDRYLHADHRRMIALLDGPLAGHSRGTQPEAEKETGAAD